MIVDATDDDSIMESRVTELHAASIMVTDVLPSTRPAEEATLLPIGDTIPWTCGVSDVLRIGGFDTWDPDMTDAELPKDPTRYSLSGTDPTTGYVGT